MGSKIFSKSSALNSTLRGLFSDEYTIMVILGIIVGVAGGYGAVGFRYLINFVQSIAYGSSDELLMWLNRSHGISGSPFLPLAD